MQCNKQTKTVKLYSAVSQTVEVQYVTLPQAPDYYDSYNASTIHQDVLLLS